MGGYAALSNYTALGGQLTVFALPREASAKAAGYALPACPDKWRPDS